MAASELVYGFEDLEGLKARRIQEIGIDETWERVQQWNAQVNQVFDTIFSSFTVRNEKWNTTPIMKYQLPVAVRPQYGDEHMVAKPQIQSQSVQVGLPLWRYELATGMTFEGLLTETIQEFSARLSGIETGDRQEAIRQFLWAIFNNANYTFASTEDNFPDIPVKAGANTDGEKYVQRGDQPPAEAQHYLAQAAAISDANDPFPAIRELLTTYVGTSANDRIITFVGDSTNSANIQALSAFNNINRTRYTTWGADVSFVDPTADGFVSMGERVLGEHEEGILVIYWKTIPDNYLVSFNLDAPKSVGIREAVSPALRGLFNINAVEESGNMLLSRFRRRMGMAPVNRTGFVVNRIDNASYAIPSSVVQPG